MRSVPWYGILGVAVLAVLVCSPAAGTIITRHIELTLSPDQISADGSFGSGVFWIPTFSLDPFILTGPGDTVSVTVSFLPGSRVIIFAGPEEQESVAALIGNPGGQNTPHSASWEFLGIEGNLFTPSLTEQQTISAGAGILTSFNPVDLTDSFFSFTGIRFSFTILDDPRLAGLPAVFDTGKVAVQTQGQVVLDVNALDVLIDIKPGSDPNCFNNDGRGVIPVAILSSLDFDATQIDPLTIVLNGQGVRVVGKGNLQAQSEDVNSDGLTDLVVQIEDIDGTYQGGDTLATLTGITFDGTAIQGTDSICIVP